MPVTYFTLLSLKRIAEISVAISLWNKDEVKNLVSKFRFSNPGSTADSDWEAIEDKAIQEVQNLPLPGTLKEEVSFIIKPIGLRLVAWMSFNWQCLSAIKLQKEFYWTSQGTIDAKKTAEALVKNENLSIRERYQLACIYCLEDYIYILWEQLNESYKEDLKCIRVHELPLVSFWSHYIKGKLDELSDMMNFYCAADNVLPYEYAFYLSAVSGNKVATRYFVQKLNSKDKDRILIRTITHVAKKRHCMYNTPEDCNSVFLLRSNHTDVLCFLLSFLNEEQQVEFFKVYLLVVLKCLLEWPWQEFFAKTVRYVCVFQEKYNHSYDISHGICEYNSLLVDIVSKININYKDYRYENLFQVFWEQIPNAHKRCVMNKCIYDPFLLSSLFRFDQEDSIRLILNDATVTEKMDIIFHVGKFNCKQLIFLGNWHFLKVFIEQCIPSKQVMIRFKEELEEYIMRCHLEGASEEWRKLSHLLDSLIHGYGKRKGIEENSSSKKICKNECT